MSLEGSAGTVQPAIAKAVEIREEGPLNKSIITGGVLEEPSDSQLTGASQAGAGACGDSQLG